MDNITTIDGNSKLMWEVLKEIAIETKNIKLLKTMERLEKKYGIKYLVPMGLDINKLVLP